MRQHRFLTQSSISDGCFRFGPVWGGWVGEVYFRMQISPAFPGLLCKTGPQNKRRCWVVQNRPPFRSISLPLPLSLAHRVCVFAISSFPQRPDTSFTFTVRRAETVFIPSSTPSPSLSFPGCLLAFPQHFFPRSGWILFFFSFLPFTCVGGRMTKVARTDRGNLFLPLATTVTSRHGSGCY